METFDRKKREESEKLLDFNLTSETPITTNLYNVILVKTECDTSDNHDTDFVVVEDKEIGDETSSNLDESDIGCGMETYKNVNISEEIVNLKMRKKSKKLFDNYTCVRCGLRFNTTRQKSKHDCKFKLKATRDNFLKQFVRVREDNTKYFQCDQCDYTCIPYPVTFTRHYKKHGDEKPYECYHCGKKFVRLNGLKVHIICKHGSGREKKFYCTFCGKRFIEKRHVTDHERIHTGEKPFTCDICGKRFKQSGSLSIHRRIELGLKNHICQICSKPYVTKTHLKRHMISKHSNLKNFSCDSCGKSFKEQHALKEHYAVHSDARPFTCVVCQKDFKYQKNLKKHCKMHRK